MDTIKVLTRTAKGSPLTTAEMDQNLTNLRDAVNSVLQATPEASLRSRGTITVTTDPIPAGSAGYVQAPLGLAYHLMAIGTDFPARVRLYQTAAHRAADAPRAVGTPPANDHGMVAEEITAPGMMLVRYAPGPFGANLDESPSETAYLSVTNRDVVPRAITVAVTRLVLEFK